MGWLDGKRALVVGAGSGIGRAVVTAFHAEGARVGALELDQAKAGRLATEMPDCVVSRGDATSLADARAAVRVVTAALGGLDVLVNCVGVFDFYRGLADIDDDQLDAAFDEIFAVNVKSQLVSVRAALPELRAAGGSVVLTVSTSGFYPGRGGVLYLASKFAVRGCVIALAHELAPGVRDARHRAHRATEPGPGRPCPGRGARPRAGSASSHAPAGRAHRRGPRGQLRVPGLRPRPRDHRHRGALRRRRRRRRQVASRRVGRASRRARLPRPRSGRRPGSGRRRAPASSDRP